VRPRLESVDRASIRAFFYQELSKAGVEPKKIDVSDAGAEGRELCAVTVVLPAEQWASALPALAKIRRRAEKKAGVPVAASPAMPRRRERRGRRSSAR
jgi:hypothetical protein